MHCVDQTDIITLSATDSSIAFSIAHSSSKFCSSYSTTWAPFNQIAHGRVGHITPSSLVTISLNSHTSEFPASDAFRKSGWSFICLPYGWDFKSSSQSENRNHLNLENVFCRAPFCPVHHTLLHSRDRFHDLTWVSPVVCFERRWTRWQLHSSLRAQRDDSMGFRAIRRPQYDPTVRWRHLRHGHGQLRLHPCPRTDTAVHS